MAQAERLPTTNSSPRDMGALRALPFVRNGNRKRVLPTYLPKSFWAARPTSSGDHDLQGNIADEAVGRYYARCAIDAIQETGYEALIDAAVLDMRGRRDGITIGFFHEIGRVLRHAQTAEVRS